MKPMTTELAEKVYDILVDVCGADKRDREVFVAQQSTDIIGEWRFCGCLGFGGKFRRDDEEMYVNCYPEDLTPERKGFIDEANRRLAKL